MVDSGRSFLPYGRQTLEEDDIAAVSNVLRGDWLTTGPTVSAFEAAFSKATDAAHAVACSSGTAALHLAALSLELNEGDWVVVPSLTFLATANAARYVGAEVWFADVDPDSGLLTPDSLKSALTAAASAGREVKAVFPVHLNGQCCDMAALRDIAAADRYQLVEDACHAVGASESSSGRAGGCAHSDMAAFSFHPVKTITTGEGGIVTTNDDRLAERLTRFRNHGMVSDPSKFALLEQAFDGRGTPNPWYYEMPTIGFNYRLSDLHAALGLSQLAKLDRFVRQRRSLVAYYDEALAFLSPAIRPIERRGHGEPAWHLYPVLIDFETIGTSRAELMSGLRSSGVGTQVHYIPAHRQPYYRDRYGSIGLPGADRYYERVLSLPLHSSLNETDIDRVVKALSDLVSAAGM